MRTPLHRLYKLRMCGWEDIDLVLEKQATEEDIQKLDAFDNCMRKKFREQTVECRLSLWDFEKLQIEKK